MALGCPQPGPFAGCMCRGCVGVCRGFFNIFYKLLFFCNSNIKYPYTPLHTLYAAKYAVKNIPTFAALCALAPLQLLAALFRGVFAKLHKNQNTFYCTLSKENVEFP